MHDKKRLHTIIPLSLLALVCSISTALAQNIVIENQSARIVISDRGRILGFQDSKPGKDYLDRAEPVPFMLARRGPVEYESTRVTRSGDRFDVGFAGSGIQATVRIQAAGTYFTLEVVAVNQTNLDELAFVSLPLTIADPWSLETYTATLEKHGRTAEILAMSRIYEDLRLRRYFPEEIKEQLRTAGQDFKLLKSPSGRWAMHPIRYGPAHLLSLCGSQPARFEYRNPHGEQRLKFRIKARPAASGPGVPGNVLLLDPAGENPWQAESGSETFAIQALASKPVEDRLSITITGANRGTDRSSWALVTRRFPEPVNLSGRRAIVPGFSGMAAGPGSTFDWMTGRPTSPGRTL